MRKVIVSIHTTLDGCMSGPIGDLDNIDHHLLRGRVNQTVVIGNG